LRERRESRCRQEKPTEQGPRSSVPAVICTNGTNRRGSPGNDARSPPVRWNQMPAALIATAAGLEHGSYHGARHVPFDHCHQGCDAPQARETH
jgi:hypothetical protein